MQHSEVLYGATEEKNIIYREGSGQKGCWKIKAL